MFCGAMCFAVSCGNASAMAANSGQDYDVGIFADDLSLIEDAITLNHFGLAAPMFAMDFHSGSYYIPVTIGKVNTKPKVTIEIRARDSL